MTPAVSLHHGASPAIRGTSCKVCSKSFLPLNSLQSVCGVKCARQVPVIAKKAAREADAKKREALKTRQQWVREAQAEFNAYIRLRDAADPCISCGRHHKGQYHAGHYISAKAQPGLRFDPANVHKQCSACNDSLSGNLVLYRAGLLRKVGKTEVERLEAYQAQRKYTADELRALRALYREKAKALLAQQEIAA